MKETLQDWLERRGRFPGVLSCGIRFADGATMSQCNSPGIPMEKLNQAWRQVAETIAGLNQQRIAASRLLWTFQESQLHCATRPDGIVLCVVTPTAPGAADPGLIEKIVEEFLQL